MIAIDTSSLIAYFHGENGEDADAVDRAFETKQGVLPPVVFTEILSDPKIDRKVARYIQELPVMEIVDGYWKRAAECRAKMLAKKLKARLADTLICQSCLDHNLPLITRDSDFLNYSKYCKLKLF